MRNGKPLLQCALLLVAVAVMVFCVAGSVWAAESPNKSGVIARPDLLKIDDSAKYQKLEMGIPIFAHDQHTEALAAMGKDCSACHLSKDGKMSLKFMRFEDKSAKNLQSLYHEKCMGCHSSIQKSGKKSGPQDGECKSCHDLAGKYVSTFVRQGYGAASHAVHVASKLVPAPAGAAQNCATCHHNVKTPGKEDSCRVCHLESHGVTPDYPTVGHTFCLDCHAKVAKQAPAAPIKCSGCHSPEAVAKQQTVTKNTPRLMRGQPDSTVMFPVTASGDGKAAMAPVVFDHKIHEGKVADCRTCHHLRISSCGSCHTAEGSDAGAYVSLEASMHKENSPRSCVGCHTQNVAKPECAGCHGFIKPERGAAYCGVCHVEAAKPADAAYSAGIKDKLPLSEKAKLAAEARKDYKPAGLPDFSKVPEVVIIDGLKDKYEGNEFNHRAHIEDYIAPLLAGNKLAEAFHTDKATLCQGCHHMSPPSMTPPKCSSCHSKAQDSGNANAGRPDLKAAYHLQCMGCHDRMQVEPVAKTDCATCHSERKK